MKHCMLLLMCIIPYFGYGQNEEVISSNEGNLEINSIFQLCKKIIKQYPKNYDKITKSSQIRTGIVYVQESDDVLNKLVRMYNDVYIVQAIINDIAHYSILETIHLDKSIIERAYIFDEWNYYGIMESILVDNVVISSDYIPYDPNQISGEKIEFDKIAYRVKKIVKNDFPN